MSLDLRPRSSIARGFRDVWRRRPALYSRPLWALMIALDRLPWPWGEDILARLFAAVALVRGSRRRPALAWASQQPGGRGLRLALAVCAFRGRWVARAALLGVRSPDALTRRAVISGEEHLTKAPEGTILLGFHLGPPNVDVTLRILGQKLAWLGTSRNSWVWSSEAWRPLSDPRQNLTPPDDEWFWPGYLYRARRILLDGGALFIMADSWIGRAAFPVPLPGGPMIVRSGWLSLRRLTGARVIPVVTHLEGRTQVITIHPALPIPAPHDADPLAAWRGIIAGLVTDYVRRFPEQCPVLALPPTALRRRRAPAGLEPDGHARPPAGGFVRM
jgi:lauroyl/myristoyl acyltransferase